MPEEIINITIEDSNEAVNITVDETTEQVNITISDGQPVKTSDLINDGEDGVHPFITLEDIPAGAVESVTGDLVDNTDPANPIINWPTLAEVLSEGNVTDGNQINLTGASAIVLENSSTLVKGTYDFGAAGGISRICGVGYEDMWQSGFRHVFDSNGLIRNTTNGFDLIPDINFDVTLRFKVGSRWTLDNGDTYECTDATEGAAVWVLVNIGIIPTLQQVTAAGNQATTDIEVNSLGLYNNDDANYGYLNWLTSSGLSFKNNTTQEVFNANKSGSSLSFINADDNVAKLDATLLTDDRNFLLQDADGTIALTTDIPDVSTLVPYTGATEDVNLGEFGLLTGNIEFDNTPTNTPTAAGSMYYNDTDGTLDLILKGGNVTLQIGQESVIRVVNKTATNITLLESNYQAVRVTGAQGQRMKVDLAQATTDPLSAETIGLVTETIANNQEGFVTTSGLVRGINTTGSLQSETWADGDILYLSPTVAGRITKVKPTAPNHLIIIGYVIHAHITQGSIFVKVDNGYELDELHNVKITTAANNNVLAYTSATDIWENKTVETALGFTPANDSNVVHLAQIETITGQKTFNPSVTAASAIAKGTVLTPTLIASANSDVLVGLDIAPTFTNGAFTGVSNYGLRVGGTITPNVNSTHNIGGGGSLRFANGFFSNTLYTQILRGVQLTFGDEIGGNYMKIFTSGNIAIQNGGTFTDVASSRLTVNSTTQGFLPPRMTTTQRNAIASPATGLLVYDTTLLSLFQYNGTAWVSNTLGYTPYRFTKPTEIVHTGVLTETILQTILIPANTFSNGDFIMFSALVSKLANIGNTNHNLKINTTNTLVGATSITLIGFNTINFSMKFKREMIVNSGNIYVLNVSANTVNDQTNNSTPSIINSYTYNLSADLYLFVTCTLGNILDTITYRGINFYKQ